MLPKEFSALLCLPGVSFTFLKKDLQRRLIGAYGKLIEPEHSLILFVGTKQVFSIFQNSLCSMIEADDDSNSLRRKGDRL